MREAKNPQLEMAKQPQIKRRIQAKMSLFHFISLTEQSSHCNRRQRKFVFQNPRQNDAEGAGTFSPRHTTVENLSSTIFDSNPDSPRVDLTRGFESKIVYDK